MKKLIFAAMAVVALAACSQDEVTDIQREYIDFVPTAKNAVRASTLVTSSNLKSFQVFAFTAEGETVMNNIKVTNDGTTGWTYTPKKYWPEGTTVDFYGLYMKDLGVTGGTYYQSQYGATATNGCAVHVDMVATDGIVDATETPDLVYAVALDREKADGAVLMQFRHAMAQVEFRIKNATTSSNNIVISSGPVYVDNLGHTGNYSLPTTSSTTETLGGLGSWGDYTNASTYRFKTDGLLIYAGETSGTIHPGPCFVFPQSVTSATFRVDCTIKQDGLVIFDGEKTATANIKWVQGCKYIITLLFDDSVLENDYINFTTNVIDMSSGGTTTVEPE